MKRNSAGADSPSFPPVSPNDSPKRIPDETLILQSTNSISHHTYEQTKTRSIKTKRAQAFTGHQMSQMKHMESDSHDDPMRYVKTIGKTVFFGKQIYQYDFDDVTSMSALFYWNGTVFKSSAVWEKLISCFVIAVVSAFLCYVVIDDIKNMTTTFMFQICIYLNALTAFLLGFYLSSKIGRWWTIRDKCIGGLRGAISNLITICSVYLDDDMDDFKHLVLRYALLSHALVYIQAQKRNDDLQDLIAMELITKDEFLTLKKLPPQAKAEAVWIWISQVFRHLIWEDKQIPKLLVKNVHDQLMNGRDSVRQVFAFIDTQLPLPYTHLLSLTVHISHLCLAVVCGINAIIAVVNKHTAEFVLQFVLLGSFCILYQGILVIGNKIENPLGFDTIDFPRLQYHIAIKESCLSFIKAGAVKPFLNAAVQFE